MTISQLILLPYAFTIAALISAVAGTVCYAYSCRRKAGPRADRWISRGRTGLEFAALLTSLAFIWLAFFFVNGQYAVDYVRHNSSADLSLYYRLGAVWAGQEGSFLLWALWTGLIGIALSRRAGRAESTVMPWYGLAFSFVLLMVVFVSPFKVTDPTKTAGMGLNPLLQDPWMTIHPPTLFLGYSMLTAPFAFAMGALLRKDYKDWIRTAAPWAIAATVLLVTALSMGGHWAYRTLGWGGFWGWDPVENASLVPMLLAVALVHGIYLQRGPNAAGQRGNIALAISAFLAMLYASYLTRSGALTKFSNHSFSELPHSAWLLGGFLGFVALGAGLFLFRFRSIPANKAYDSPASREFGFYLSAVILIISAAVVAVGTSSPLIMGWFGSEWSAPPAFYNQTMAPVGMLMALMLAVYPLASRDGSNPGKLARKLAAPSLLGLAAAILVVVLSYKRLSGPDLAAAAGLAFGGVLAMALNAGVVLRMARSGGIVSAGGYVTHVGFGVLLLGIVASGLYTRTERVRVEMNDKAQAFGYRFRLLNSGKQVTPLRTEIPMWVMPSDGAKTPPPAAKADISGGWLGGLFGKRSFVLRPTMARDRNGNAMTSPGIVSHLTHDLYVAPVEFDPGSWEALPITLGLGDVYQFGPLKILLMGVEPVGEEDSSDFAIRANILAVRFKEHAQVSPEMNLQSRAGNIVSLPGGARINIDPNTALEGKLTLDLIGPNAKRTEPWTVVDVSIKPYIWLVWTGMVLMILGGTLAVIRRVRENRRFVAEGLDQGAGSPISALTNPSGRRRRRPDPS